MKIVWHQEHMPHMNIRENNGVTYLTWPEFEKIPGFVHGFSTRLGGVSEGIYSSMNLSFTRGDKEEAVRENYNRISAALGFSPEDIVTSDQTHTANVCVITAGDRGNGITKPRPYTDVDGMVTNVPGLVLATFYADCVPLYFVDPVHKAVGLSHSGWRGTAAGIGAVTVKKLQEHYGSRPEDIYAAIGPSICQDCYEVSEDVILEFQKTFSRELWKDIFYKKENGKYQLNLWEANRQILLGAGVLPDHISMPNLCTCCNPEFLYSHRASQGKRGNLGAFLGIKR
ncbi:peptidoglycan editing factor PgeF [Blautia sp. XA-2221]|uniref:peptidoglycan editing factor PgeF n=1 Tax=Blautia sp. XA-2221 TaxID=2903961 RepID=UPI002378A1A8|nr:peptidoglycan editing factor PgeF [Blautia sp. XA-2221]